MEAQTVEYVTNDLVSGAYAEEIATKAGRDLQVLHRPESCRTGRIVLDMANLVNLGFDLEAVLRALTDPAGKCRVRAAHAYHVPAAQRRLLRQYGIAICRRLPAALARA
jgi:hypothetical protein